VKFAAIPAAREKQWSPHGDGVDGDGEAAAGGGDDDGLADPPSEERPPQRRAAGHLALAGACLRGRHDDVGLRAAVPASDDDCRANLDVVRVHGHSADHTETETNPSTRRCLATT